jgi:PilZ domain
MTTLQEMKSVTPQGLSHVERRAHRRADFEGHEIPVERWDGGRRVGTPFGRIVDISADGIRIRTQQNIRPDHQIRLRLELPEYAGISPFIDNTGPSITPKREWVGWLAISRVQKVDAKTFDVAGRLVDMEEIDRGMLGLYLSTQPLAA